MSRWLITGSAGQLGTDLRTLLADRPGLEVVGVDLPELDITDPSAVQKFVEEVRPELLINAAAYTAVDAAESNEELAQAVNGLAPGILAEACARHGIRLVHVSTDYVFPGDGTVPYEVDSPTGPRSAYGRTKLAGELAVRAALPDASWVVRTAWVYGAGGQNFVKTMVRLERSHETVDVVDDQRGSPTWSADLARGLVSLADSAARPGVYHCTNGGDTTWYGLTRAIFEELGADPDRVRPTTTDRYPRPAPRPAYSVLSGRSWRDAGLPELPHWRAALHEAFARVGPALTA